MPPPSKFEEGFGEGGEVDVAFGGDHDHVFDANAAASGNIDAGFYGDDHAAVKHIVAVRGNRRRFVNVQSYTVTRGMTEKSLIACLIDIGTSRFVHFAAACAFVYGFQRIQLRLKDSLVNAS